LFRLAFELPTSLETSAVMFFTSRPSADSWRPLLAAIAAVHQTSATVYQTVFFEDGVKFQYPPTSLLPMEVLRALSTINPDFMSIGLLNLVSWPILIATIVLSGLVILCAMDKYLGIDMRRNRLDMGLLVVAVSVLGVTFYPLVRSYGLGQVQTWIDCAVAGLILAWMVGRRALSGALAGLCCLVKPQFALLFAWALIRKERRFVLGGVAAAAPLVTISLLAYGLDDYIDYMKVLSFIGQHGEAYFPNQSVNGLLNRLLFNGDNLVWQSHLFPPYNTLVYIGTLLSSALLLGLALFWRRREHDRASAIDLCIILLSVTMASPVAWEHHYGVLLPIFALVLPATLSARELGRYRVVVVIVAFALVSNLLSVTDVFATSRLNVMQSYLLFGAVLLLVHMYRLRGAMARRHGEADPRPAATRAIAELPTS
jgi:hypothetical protein